MVHFVTKYIYTVKHSDVWGMHLATLSGRNDI